jgi:hypothetical protein
VANDSATDELKQKYASSFAAVKSHDKLVALLASQNGGFDRDPFSRIPSRVMPLPLADNW